MPLEIFHYGTIWRTTLPHSESFSFIRSKLTSTKTSQASQRPNFSRNLKFVQTFCDRCGNARMRVKSNNTKSDMRKMHLPWTKLENRFASNVSPYSKANAPKSRCVKVLFINPISVGIVPVRSLAPFMTDAKKSRTMYI